MLTQENFKRITDISIPVVNKYSSKWSKATVFTGYCHNGYNSFHLSYQDGTSKDMSLWGETYSNLAKNQYSFEGYEIINKILNEFYQVCKDDNKLHWNRGRITIYPSGKYESEFIWDNEAYLEHLTQRAEIWLSLIFNEAYYRIQDRCDVLSIEWDFTTEVVVTFTNGISNPVLFITENNPVMTFSLFLEQIFFYIENDYVEEFEAYAKVRKIDSDFVTQDTESYLMLNEGELKGRYPRWNVMRFTVNPKSEPIFEWREDLT